MNEAKPPWLATLWAKTGKDDTTHLLVYHLIDVAEVAHSLWNNVLSAKTRAVFSQALDLSEVQAGYFTAFIVGLHDLGKASPDFQRKYEKILPLLREQGLSFGFGAGMGTVHGIVSAVALGYRGENLLYQAGLANKPVAQAIARAIGGHHGIWPDSTELKRTYDVSDQAEWIEARKVLFAAFYDLYTPPALPENVTAGTESFNTFLMLISGFTTVADWIGSMSEHFPLEPNWLPLESYRERARWQAREALHKTGWLKDPLSAAPLSFIDLLPHAESEPNPIQETVLDCTGNLVGQWLILLEAPTGIGKTELAFHLSHQIIDKSRLYGFYIAMPTQATSNQMYQRTARFLHRLLPDQVVEPRLLHSQAAWQIDEKRPIPIGIYDEEAGVHTGNVPTWFRSNKKRGLLEPFAVGTVDQALLSVLWTRHFFVRLFGLHHKVLIFDEVHAYDAYMSELFMTLLAWMRWLGSSVIILSATLPNDTRRKLVQQFGGTPAALEETEYCNARLTLVSAEGQTTATPLDGNIAPREVQIEWIDQDVVIAVVEEALQQGGCVAVMCNTVGNAQEIYKTLRTAQESGHTVDCKIILFHARYPAAWREGIEQGVLEDFGRDGTRPERAILVATQVIEQSLDLDFDLLITELAPIDLLIQRIGRLHRHPREHRPAPFRSPRMLIIQPILESDMPFGKSTFVYGDFLLLATWAALQGRDRLCLPDESRVLIEMVYGEGWRSLDWADRIANAQPEYLSQLSNSEYHASLKHIPLPDAAKLLDGHNVGLDEDNPMMHEQFRAMTREMEPSVQVICVHRVGDLLSLEPDGSEPVDPRHKPDPRRLLRYTVSISRPHLLNAIAASEEHELPKAWAGEAALKYHRIAVFENNECRVAGTRTVLRLTREYGLEITQEVH